MVLDSFFHSAVFLLYVRVAQSLFNMGERAEFICETHKTDFVSFSLFLKWMTWLDICRGRDISDVNIALSKIVTQRESRGGKIQ